MKQQHRIYICLFSIYFILPLYGNNFSDLQQAKIVYLGNATSDRTQVYFFRKLYQGDMDYIKAALQQYPNLATKPLLIRYNIPGSTQQEGSLFCSPREYLYYRMPSNALRQQLIALLNR